MLFPKFEFFDTFQFASCNLCSFFFSFFFLNHINSNKTKTFVYFFFGRNLASSKVKFRDRAKNSDLHWSVTLQVPVVQKIWKRIFFMIVIFLFFSMFKKQQTAGTVKKSIFTLNQDFSLSPIHPNVSGDNVPRP